MMTKLEDMTVVEVLAYMREVGVAIQVGLGGDVQVMWAGDREGDGAMVMAFEDMADALTYVTRCAWYRAGRKARRGATAL